MAKSLEYKTKIEPFIRGALAEKHPGHTFAEKPLPLRKRKDGTYAYHKFDAVSEDNSIVASIKSNSWQTSSGKRPAGKIGEIYQSLYFLGLVHARIKLLILTNNETYEGFLRVSDGKIAEDIVIAFYPLSAELQQLATEMKERASQEMSK
jgi:hypothetical protein